MMANPVAHFDYTGEAIRKVAECFGSVATVAPFQLKTGDVQIVEVAPSDGIERTRITFWPSLEPGRCQQCSRHRGVHRRRIDRYRRNG